MFKKEVLVPDYEGFHEIKLDIVKHECFVEALEMFLNNPKITEGKLDILFPKNNHPRLFINGVSASFQEIFPNAKQTQQLDKNILSVILKKTPKSEHISCKDGILSISITDNFNMDELFGIDLKKIKSVKIVMSSNISKEYGNVYQKRAETIIQVLSTITRVREDVGIHCFSLRSKDKVFLEKLAFNDEISFPMDRCYLFDDRRELIGVHLSDYAMDDEEEKTNLFVKYVESKR